MKLESPKTLKFYTSPKIHKKENLGRPVVNSVNYHTSNLSKFVDHYLQPHIQNLLSHVKIIPEKVRYVQEDPRDKY